MKILILYATKHGASREIASRIAKRLDGSATHDLKQGGVPALTGFDCIIIGGSLYAGMLRKEAKAFLKQNANSLKGKKIGLFLSGMQPIESEVNKAFEMNVPAEILQSAKAKGFLGGIFDPGKAGGMERLIFKAVTKLSAYTDTIDDAKIQKFVEELQR